MDTDRRRFLAMTGGLLGASAVGGFWVTRNGVDAVEPPFVADEPAGAGPTAVAVEPPPPEPAVAAGSGRRVLVVVQLGGGNDAINTFVPASGRYRDLRPTIAIDERDMIALDGLGQAGLHPAAAPLAGLWSDGRLAICQGVGFADQSRSHFQALDTWWRATTEPEGRTGWLGRWLDETLTGEPDPLRAVALGGGSPALASDRSLATVVQTPQSLSLWTPPTVDDLTDRFAAMAEPLADDPWLAAAQSAIPATIEAAEALAGAAGFGNVTDTPSRAGTIATLLATAAGLIELDVGTQVILVAAGGFDTHAEQPTTHAELLEDVATGITSFLATVEAIGRGDDVVVMTTSEFGRRAAENGSAGTDHGKAGTQLLVGAGVDGAKVVGEVDLDRLDDGDVRVDVDTRSLYAAALDWLGGPTDEVLGGVFDRYELLT